MQLCGGRRLSTLLLATHRATSHSTHTRFATSNAMHDAHCRAFYIDLGSNIGVQIRKLFEPKRYPLAAAQPIFNHYFSRSRQHVCAIGVEPNPQHYNRLRALEGYYHAHNHTFAFIAATTP